MRHTPEYELWAAAKQRCTNPNVKNYKDYGGRGIKFLLTFEQFFDELGPRPKNMTLDRKDNDGHYEPGNIWWATRSQQRINQRKRTHCKRGHSLADAYVWGGHQSCRACRRDRECQQRLQRERNSNA
jgi:hypothetical protein